MSPRTRLVMVNSPHNPSGSTLSREDLIFLQALVERHNLLVISDEVYEHLVFDGRRHHSALEFEGLRARSFVLFSLRQDLQRDGLEDRLLRRPGADHGTAQNPPVCLLRRGHPWCNWQWRILCRRNRVTPPPWQPSTSTSATCSARRCKSRFSFAPSAGTYFQLLDYSAISDEPDIALCELWTRQHGIASIPISVFYETPPTQHYLRFASPRVTRCWWRQRSDYARFERHPDPV